MPNPFKAFFKTDLRILRVTGEKSAVFLHGQLTNSIKDLPPGRGNFNLLLDTKGKVRAACHVLNRGAFFELIAAPDSAEKLNEQLLKLAPLSRCVLSPLPEAATFHFLTALPDGIACPEPGAFIAEPEKNFAVFRSDRLGCEGYDVVVQNPAGFAKDAGDLARQGFAELTAEAAELVRVKNGAAKVGVDVTEANLPQEGRLDEALHFNKGCYLGQEIIARLHYKGHVNKILAHFRVAGEVPANDADIRDETGRAVGKLTSSAYDPVENTSYVLGYVPAKAVPDARFAVGGKPLDRLAP